MRGTRRCDNWWEPETPWHREWKNRFPPAWREVIQHASDGEKHIADIRSPSGKVIEFQHSRLKPDERRAREAFYGDMFWVVDGTRTERGRINFSRGVSIWRNWGTGQQRLFVTHFASDGLPSEWLASSVPVLFDFGEEQFEWERQGEAPRIWYLSPRRPAGYAVIFDLPKAIFVDRYIEDAPFFDPDRLKVQVNAVLEQLKSEKGAAYWPR
jgi:hypothetical protein